jgi:hypothetical protein
VFATGYQQRLPFFSSKDCSSLGVPHEWADESPDKVKEWNQLECEAEAQILKAYPVLGNDKNIPEYLGDINPHLAPFRLYRGIAPLNRDPTIAFVGFAIWVNMFESAEITALRAIAYLDGNVKLPNIKEMKRTVAYTTTYMRLRIPTYGRIGNFYMYDRFAHQEQLLFRDLGLKSRCSQGLWTKWLRPSLPSDFRSIKDEYLEKYGGRVS